jgi:elongation factor 1-alpha
MNLDIIEGLNNIRLGELVVSEPPPITPPVRNVCVTMAGSVDAGKSTLIGVLFSGELDDGDGSAREEVAKHNHELVRGATSDIATKILDFKDGKKLVLVDLCGHLKYLKTTMFGITGYFPDYGIIVVSGSKGISDMTIEHLAILSFMNIPLIVVITKIDIAPDDKYKKTINKLIKYFRHPRIKKTPVLINDEIGFKLEEHVKANSSDITGQTKLKEIYDKAAVKISKITERIEKSDIWIPVITVSNKTGYFINELKQLLYGLKPRKRNSISSSEIKGNIFYIDSVFVKNGTGLIVSGTLFGQTIKIGDHMLLGPSNKHYLKVKVWSIHNDDETAITELKDHEKGCLAIRNLEKKTELRRNDIKKGMVILKNELLTKNTCLEFQAEIEVLHHKTEIRSRYTPTIHCGTIVQPAQIKLPNIIIHDTEKKEDITVEKKLKTGDKEIVWFRFIGHPEFMEIGMIFFFREGSTRGYGKVIGLKPLSEDHDPPARHIKKKFHRPTNKPKIIPRI